jgi:hypothetical protein
MVLLAAQGWRDHDDADALRHDPAMRLAVKVVVSAISYFLYIDGQRVRNFAVYARALGSLIIACLNLERLGELGSIVESKAFENSLSCISKGI